MLSYYVITGFWLNRNNQKRVKLLHCLIFYVVLYGFYTMLVMIVVEYPLIIHWATLTSKLYEFLFLMVRAVHETFSFLFRCSCFSASRKNTHKRVYIWLRAERKCFDLPFYTWDLTSSLWTLCPIMFQFKK